MARSPLALLTLAESHLVAGFAGEAEALAAEIAVGLDRGQAAAALGLAGRLREANRLAAAETLCRAAVAADPDLAAARHLLGAVLHDRGPGCLDEAEACYRRAAELDETASGPLADLGALMQLQARLFEAEDVSRAALARRPNAFAWNNLGVALRDQGRIEHALDAFRAALAVKPDFAEAHSNLLFCMQYHPEVGPEALLEAHRDFDRRHCAPLAPPVPWPVRPLGRRKLRLGLVSADFGAHPIGWFTSSVLEAIDPDEVELHAYSDRGPVDDLTRRMQRAVPRWRDVRGLDDETLAGVVRADGIDALIDLAGHTARNRLLVFARKPAPVQASWAGYVGTTGLSTMDLVVGDRFHTPEGEDHLHAERVLRMPNDYICYAPPADAPPVGPPPALARGGRVTFGCFNAFAKIGPETVMVWARILHRVPESRLILKCRPLGDPQMRATVAREFAIHGIAPERLDLRGHSPHAELLAQYGEVDIALDTFPYSGGLTTLEALWMGVPVITRPGRTFAGRHSLSHLSNVGLGDLIAPDFLDYVGRARALAGDLDQLAALRHALRPWVAASPVCDAAPFARTLVDELTRCYQRMTDTKV